MSKEAMKLALEALDIVKIHFTQNRHVNEAITALQETLAKPDFWEGYVPEPVKPAQQEYASFAEWAHDYVQANLHKLKPAQQEPVLQDIEQYRLQMAGISTAAIGYWKESDGIHPDYDTVALRDVAKLYAKYDELYKAQRTWVGLTDEEIEQGCKESWVTEQAWQSAVWWAEAKLKEKNT